MPQRRDLVRFMLLMPWGRVGSNLLIDILRQSAPMKLQNENLIHVADSQRQLEWISEFYETDRATHAKRYIGSKQNVRSIRDAEAFSLALRGSGVRVVCLWRRNLLKSAVSQIRGELYAEKTARESGAPSWAVKKGATPLEATRIDPDLLLKRVSIMEQQQIRMEQAFSAVSGLDLEYEELHHNLTGAVSRLRSFLEVPQVPFSVQFVKATPDTLSDAIVNFPEVQERLASTPYAKYLLS